MVSELNHWWHRVKIHEDVSASVFHDEPISNSLHKLRMILAAIANEDFSRWRCHFSCTARIACGIFTLILFAVRFLCQARIFSPLPEVGVKFALQWHKDHLP